MIKDIVASNTRIYNPLASQFSKKAHIKQIMGNKYHPPVQHIYLHIQKNKIIILSLQAIYMD
ncbi:hypothetical protein C1I94_07760 [Akkermansia muciniphila]|nr:hypothetical protein CUC06_07170 [Akkermansia muciniphila]MBE5697087.1 hypothetical protein [Akkermansia sp.]PNC42953.1 hypothetical protein CXU08_08370 [Akkermansia muciniphila]PNC52216.1 hypothetical protein CXU06_11755 [Akkermansia muciniphila]PNC63968.1 hypothetical protein CXU07_04345 [Akkermansia muciniphila]